MMQALVFGTWWLLFGVLAAAIPVLLHLLAKARAQEVYFPTLRFLRMSMEKTARRRRIQHWLLMLIRAALLALLALAVAEPISQATGNWLGGKNCAAVIILDNSLSMAAASPDAAQATRFAQAKAQAAALLGGDEKPALASLVTTAGPAGRPELTARLDHLREALARAEVSPAPAMLVERVAAAAQMLAKQSNPNKSIYIFSDMQKDGFEKLLRPGRLSEAKDMHIFVVNVADRPARNVGITDLDVAGRRIVNEPLEFTATLVNSSTSDQAVDVVMRIDGVGEVNRLRQDLGAAGREGSQALVRFRHRFTTAGVVTGEVVLQIADDLAADNVRRFCLDIGRRARALIVRGSEGAFLSADPSIPLQAALLPFGADSAAWPITARVVTAAKLAPADLAGADAAFLCNVAKFTAAQARQIEAFARDGGTAVFFLGPDVQAANYNELFVQQVAAEGGLLPARIGEPVGQVGPDADAVATDWVDLKHPYLAGLYESPDDYLTPLVQRYFQLARSPRPPRVLMRLANGDPLLLVKPFGKGRVVLCTTGASLVWSNLPITGLFLPMVNRMTLLARQGPTEQTGYLAGSQVIIRPGSELPADAAITVTPPGSDGEGRIEEISLPLRTTEEGPVATFARTWRTGVYRWAIARDVRDRNRDKKSIGGAFVVNGHGPESRLETIDAETFKTAMGRRNLKHVYVAATTEAANAAAVAEARGRNWWDTIAAIVIVILVVEAVAANRRRREDVIPAHLNPRIAA